MNLIITQDGEVVTDEYTPSALQTALESVYMALHGLVSKISREVRMAVFDARNGTNYRAIRHQLEKEQKRAQFESRIGLIRV